MAAYVPTTEEAGVLASTNVTMDVLSALMWTCQDVAWMANVKPWNGMKSYDVVAGINGFLNSNPDITNKSEAAPQLAGFLGVAEDRVQLVYDMAIEWYGWPFPDLLESLQEVLPMAGHPAHDSDVFIGILTILTFAAAVFLGLRIWSRMAVNGFIRGHDWVLFAAALVTFGLSIMNAACLANFTHFRGLWDRSWQDMRIDNTSSIATSVLYPLGVFLIKTSLLLFYWSLTEWWPLRIASTVTWVVVFGNCLTMIFTHIFRCKYPIGGESVDQYWNNECKTDMFILATDVTGAINIVTDIAIWIIPLPMVWKISSHPRERILATLTFGVGALACIACGFRFYSIRKALQITLLPPSQSEYLIWTMAEMYLGVICSCVPAIRALIVKKAPVLIGSDGSISEMGPNNNQEKPAPKNESIIRVYDSSDRGSSDRGSTGSPV